MFKKIKYTLRILCSTSVILFFSFSVAHSLTVRNYDDFENHISVEFFRINGAISENELERPGSCWDHLGPTLGFDPDIIYGKEIILATNNISSVPSRHICLYFKVAAKKFTTNPLPDVPGCVIEVVSVLGDEFGEARASVACKYTGRCDDGLWYNADEYGNLIPPGGDPVTHVRGRADLETPEWQAHCLPQGFSTF